MTYPLAHKIIKPFHYTNAANTNIRILFERFRNAEITRYPVLDGDLVPTGATQREEPEFSRAECF
jgi:hypothetical protein